MLLLGLIGIVVPLMPTTIFLILAAWCFGRSSTRLEKWMLDHPRFGPVLREWRERGAMSAYAKTMACSGITLGYLVFLATARPSAWLALFVAFPMLVCAIWIAARPQ